MGKTLRKLRKIDDEEWKDIPNTNGMYQVSNYGRVKSFMYNKEDGHILKGGFVKKYRNLQIRINNKPKTVMVHKLVAEAWIPKPSSEHTIVSHIDKNQINNHISNLRWQTEEETRKINGELYSNYYKYRRPPLIITNSKLKANDIVLLKTMLQRGVPQVQIAKMFCISEMQVTRIKRGINWGHIKVT